MLGGRGGAYRMIGCQLSIVHAQHMHGVHVTSCQAGVKMNHITLATRHPSRGPNTRTVTCKYLEPLNLDDHTGAYYSHNYMLRSRPHRYLERRHDDFGFID